MKPQTAIQRLQINSDRLKVNAWLDNIKCINQQERQEVLDNCAADPECRAYFVGRYNLDCAK